MRAFDEIFAIAGDRHGRARAAFNTWMDQSDRSLSEISRVLAISL